MRCRPRCKGELFLLRSGEARKWWVKGGTSSYTFGMKTAISVPDELYAKAEAEAGKQGVSRSELYRVALREYLKRRQDEDVTARIERYFEAHPENEKVNALGELSDDEFLRRIEW